MTTEQPKGLIFDIQAHSVHDGPGARTTVFLSGCPLDCVWCCNPEGLYHKPVLRHFEKLCKQCGRCAAACPKGAITYDEDGCGVFDRAKCDVCDTHDCIQACFHEGLGISGKYYTVDDLMKIFARDRQFWGATGGVTFSGGEPLLQKNFIKPVLRKCKETFIHTCIETTSYLPTSYYLDVLKDVDWLFTDIKHMNPQKHKELTGVDNSLILENIRQMASSDLDLFPVIRMPVVPGCNDDDENIRATARFMKEVGLEVLNLLPFHRLGESKYRQLGRTYRFADRPALTEQQLEGKKRIVEEEGVTCYIGHQTPF